MPTSSHYDTLEVSPRASAEIIRAAYKSLMQRHHPDKNLDGAESTPLAASIALAYEVLSDPQRRQAYDQTLAMQQTAQALVEPYRHRNPTAAEERRAGPNTVKRPSAWQLPLLILGIILAGGSILVLSKNKAPAGVTTPDSMPFSKPANTRPDEAPIAVMDAGQIRTISGFATDLAIELTPDPGPTASVHVLRIPSLSLRLAISEPDRWTRRIQEQRPAIIQQLLTNLATVKYLELIQPDGELYLKKLVEDSVSTVTGLDASSALPVAGQPGRYMQAVEALLPVSFSVQ